MKRETRQASPALEKGPIGASWSDSRLVRKCLEGNEQAWAALIERYKRLIYYIPMKYGCSPDDAADIFQAVCLDMFSDLSKLRKTESLRSWLISVTVHKSYHWKKRQRGDVELDTMEQELVETSAVAPPQLLEEVEREQDVRDAIGRLPARCAEMVRLLFYQQPPPPYAEVARRLGVATGSIGFIRGRCLKRLQKILEEMGF